MFLTGALERADAAIRLDTREPLGARRAHRSGCALRARAILSFLWLPWLATGCALGNSTHTRGPAWPESHRRREL